MAHIIVTHLALLVVLSLGGCTWDQIERTVYNKIQEHKYYNCLHEFSHDRAACQRERKDYETYKREYREYLDYRE
jgi:hypothetical protein